MVPSFASDTKTFSIDRVQISSYRNGAVPPFTLFLVLPIAETFCDGLVTDILPCRLAAVFCFVCRCYLAVFPSRPPGTTLPPLMAVSYLAKIDVMELFRIGCFEGYLERRNPAEFGILNAPRCFEQRPGEKSLSLSRKHAQLR